MTFRVVARAGTHYRVADPDWEDPLDGTYSKTSGGRWNAPGTFPVVYLNATVEVARANVLRRFAGQPFGVLDLREERRPALVQTDLPSDDYIDVASEDGCVQVGLPRNYPLDAAGESISWDVCQPIGQAAWDGGYPGIASRSAALPRDPLAAEVAWFQRRGLSLPLQNTKPFEEWFS